MLDTFGFLHIEGALSPDELREAQEAADRYVHLATNDPTQLPPGFGQGGDARTPWAGDDARRFVHGFAFDKALERLAVHPAIWPIVLELTATDGATGVSVPVAGKQVVYAVAGGRMACQLSNMGKAILDQTSGCRRRRR